MSVQELNIHALWAAKQTAQGTPNTAGTKRLVQLGGDLKVSRDDGSQNYSDLGKFGDATDWLNALSGGGSPVAEMTPEELAYLLWLFHGGETVTTGTSAVITLTLTGTPTGGTILFRDPRGAGYPSLLIPYNASVAATQALCDTAYGAGNVLVAGGTLPGATQTLTFQAALARRPMREPVIVTNSLTGGATPTGTMVTTTPGVKNRHRFVALPGLGFWSTWHRRVGQNLITRTQYNDVQMSQIVYEASTGAKAGRVTSTLMSLDPGEVAAVDPGTALPVKRPFLHTDGVGTFELQGDVHRGISQFQVTLNEDLQTAQSDDVLPYDMILGNAAANIATTLYFDADGLARYNEQVYGTATPASGAKPTGNLPELGAFVHDLQARDAGDGFVNGDRVLFTAEGVKWNFPEAPDPNADGGPAEISLAGQLRKPTAGGDHYVIDVYCDDAAFTT
jgi:hypothetical protein